ncbi:MAG: hypothetical protein ACI89X_000174 [Planctomycetota bacterium]
MLAAALSFLLAAAAGAQVVPKPVVQDPPAAKPVVGKPQGQKPDPTKSGAVKPGTGTPGTGTPGTGTPETGTPESVKPAAKLESATPVAGEPVTAKNAQASTGQEPQKPTAKPGTVPKGTVPKGTAPVGKPVKERPASPQRKFFQFTTPDGSRFHLIQDPTVAHIHWAIASWADGRDDPPGLPGLALAAAQASLAGTWTTGSSDPDAERAVLIKLDEAWQRQLAQPGNAKIAAQVVKLNKAAAELGDRRMFERVLAAAPAFQAEVLDRDPLAVFSLTTIEPAIETVAKLLLERREEQALRGLARAWVPSVLFRLKDHATHPRRRLYAEVLALLMPSSPANARMEAPPFVAPDRDRAQRTWQASQHPTNTVHVLMGSFDPGYLKKTLNLVFAETKLIAPTRRDQAPRPLRGQRRSIVPGMRGGGGAIAWVLPPIKDPAALQQARRWLMDERGPLRRAFRKKRPNFIVDCRAPWPTTTSGQSLLLLDVQDPNGKPGLVNEVLAICKTIAAKPFSKNQFYRNYLEISRDWNRAADSPRAIAVMLAERALVWPSAKLDKLAPQHRHGQKVYTILKAVFASHPAAVEAK